MSRSCTASGPQPGVLFPVQSKSAFVIVHLHDKIFSSSLELNNLKKKLVEPPIVINPPYIPSNDTNNKDESILIFAGRLSEPLPINDFALVIGFGTNKYHYFFNNTIPEGCSDFKERHSVDNKHCFPNTGGDLFFHIKSGENAEEINAMDRMIEKIQSELECFSLKITVRKAFNEPDGRNQFGFFDAGSMPAHTANPVLDYGPVVNSFPSTDTYKYCDVDKSIRDSYPTSEIVNSLQKKQQFASCARKTNTDYPDIGRISTTFINNGCHANGSFAIWQEYIHDLSTFKNLSKCKQNAVFGRQKESGAFIQTSDPLGGSINKDYPRAHIVRTHIRMTDGINETADVDPLIQNVPGTPRAPLQITRQASSFKDGDTQGLAFVAYAKDTLRFNQILDRMIGNNVTWPKPDDHSTDHLLDFTKAITGQYFYIPNMKELTSMINIGPQKHYDIVIVGAGVSGCYSAVKLKEKYGKSKSIGIFEQANYIGGRLVSVIPPKFKELRCELGGMRFADYQTKISNLVKELNLPKEELIVDGSINPAYVRGKISSTQDLKDPKIIRSIYNIPESEISDEDLPNLFHTMIKRLGYNPADKNIREKLLKGKDSNEIPFINQSIKFLFENTLGNEAFEYQKVITGYYSPWGDWNSIDAIIDNGGDFAETPKFYKLTNGYQSLVTTLADQFKDIGGEIYLNQSLQSIEFGNKHQFNLTINGSSITTDSLILAMPRTSIERIKFPITLPKSIYSVVPRPFFKLVMCYDELWWNKKYSTPLTGESLSDTNIRQIYYWGTDPNKKNGPAAVMIYDDGLNPETWSALTLNDSSPINSDWQSLEANDALIAEGHRLFTQIHGLQPSDVTKPYSAAFIPWTENSVLGGGVNFWRVGFESQQAIEQVMNPFPDLPLYITGSCYSNLQGWVEGALDTATQVLSKYFDIPYESS